MITNPTIWRRLYRAEPIEQRGWDLAIRGVRDLLIRQPETLDGVLLKKTTDAAGDLALVMSIKPKDRKQFKAAIAFLLQDGYLVHAEDGCLLIRNFRNAQTGSTAAPELVDDAESVAPGSASLSEKRREAGRKGGLVAQANRGFASSKPVEQTNRQTEQVASSKTEASAPARDPEDQRREEKSPKESTTSLKTGQVVAREDTPVVVVETQENDHDRRVPCPPDLRLLPAQRATLEGIFMPGWAIDEITRSFVASATADPSDRRTLEHWRKCLSKACCGDWNNAARRPKKPPDEAEQEASRKKAEERQRRQREHEARELAEDTRRAQEQLRKAGHDPDNLVSVDIEALVAGIG